MEPKPPSLPQTQEKAEPKIDASTIKGLTKPLFKNGIAYLPSPGDPNRLRDVGEKYASEKWLQELNLMSSEFAHSLDEIENDGDVLFFTAPFMSAASPSDSSNYYGELGGRLADEYIKYKCTHESGEPPWFDNLNDEAKRLLSFFGVWQRTEKFKPHLRFQPMFYTGISNFAIEDAEKYNNLDSVFRLYRLNSIKQFGYKGDPLTISKESRTKRHEHHTRYRHVYSVLALANLLGTNAGIPAKDLEILQIAAVTHDYRTPAGGDTTKIFVDPEFFDEDAHYNEIFETEGWKEFAKKYKITPEQQEKLYRTILGEGILGKLLDLADKITYVASDAHMYLSLPSFTPYFEPDMYTRSSAIQDPGYRAIKEAIDEDPAVADIWGSIEIIDSNPVITNGAKLVRFLKLRALMFRELYMSHYSRFFLETFMGMVTKHMCDKGIITKEILLTENDRGLDRQIEEFIGFDMYMLSTSPQRSTIHHFETIEQAKTFAKGFNQDSDKIAIVDDYKFLPDPATKKFLVQNDGQIVPFNVAFPNEAKEIEKVIQSIAQINVYEISLDDLQIPVGARAKAKEIFKVK